jgi:hypothetical protein
MLSKDRVSLCMGVASDRRFYADSEDIQIAGTKGKSTLIKCAATQTLATVHHLAVQRANCNRVLYCHSESKLVSFLPFWWHFFEMTQLNSDGSLWGHVRWMKKELGIKLKNGKLSAK